MVELPASGHDPILVDEIGELLQLKDGAIYIDCTLGRGGHSSAYVGKLGKTGTLIGLDADERNLTFARPRVKAAADGAAIRLFHANFADVGEVCRQVGVAKVDAILADLGVSTNQLFDPDYGMSMSVDGPLDMRLNPEVGISAAEMVNEWEEEQLADIFFHLADERWSRRIARKITAERKIAPILTTGRLADIVRAAIGGRGDSPIDPATRTFQALRMEANREVENLEKLLQVAPLLVTTGGRLAIMSFHSGEDRRVKEAFKAMEASGNYWQVTKKPVTPSEAEIERNPRSRSAKLRVLERL